MPKKSFGLTKEEQERLARHPAGVPRSREDWALLERVAQHEKLCCPWGVLNAYRIGAFNMHAH